MITKEQESLNQLLAAEEFKTKVEDLVSEYLNRCHQDQLLGVMECTKLKLASFIHQSIMDKMNKEGSWPST